jgi:hypothetical protein
VNKVGKTPSVIGLISYSMNDVEFIPDKSVFDHLIIKYDRELLFEKVFQSLSANSLEKQV